MVARLVGRFGWLVVRQYISHALCLQCFAYQRMCASSRRRARGGFQPATLICFTFVSLKSQNSRRTSHDISQADRKHFVKDEAIQNVVRVRERAELTISYLRRTVVGGL